MNTVTKTIEAANQIFDVVITFNTEEIFSVQVDTPNGLVEAEKFDADIADDIWAAADSAIA